jgi:hypothetical protein
MKRTLVLSAVAVALALGLAASAAAKGPSKAEVSGPGAGKGGLVFSGDGEGPGTPLGDFVGGAGFFPAVYGQEPDPMLPGRPQGELGPKYTVTYTVPGPNGTDTLSQDLYPYAVSGPVAYMAPGQSFFGSEHTRGGWFRGPASFRDDLVQAGLPATAPAPGGSSFPSLGDAWTLVAIALAGALLIVVTSLVARRRRTPAPAS